MSDQGRKDFKEQIKEAAKPDSEKTHYEQAKESVTDAADNMASKLQPESEKGLPQSTVDSAHHGKMGAETEEQADGIYTSVAETASEYLEAAKSKLGAAAGFVSDKIYGDSSPPSDSGTKYPSTPNQKTTTIPDNDVEKVLKEGGF